MKRLRRFYYITAPKGAVIHRAEGRMNGDLTFCGRPIRCGWSHWVELRSVPKNRAMCAGCS